MKDIKDTELKQMEDLNNWKEITKGLYRYVVSANVCYEIHVNICKEGEPILTINSSLFLVGDFYDKNKVHFFVRQCLLENQAFQKCIEKAIQDYKENMS
jgi:hypothetical protein